MHVVDAEQVASTVAPENDWKYTVKQNQFTQDKSLSRSLRSF